MENDILDSIEPIKNIKNAKNSFWIFFGLILFTISLSILPFSFGTPKSLVAFIFICFIIAPFIGVFYAYRSFKMKEDSIWLKMLGTLGNGLYLAISLTGIINGEFIELIRYLLGPNSL